MASCSESKAIARLLFAQRALGAIHGYAKPSRFHMKPPSFEGSSVAHSHIAIAFPMPRRRSLVFEASIQSAMGTSRARSTRRFYRMGTQRDPACRFFEPTQRARQIQEANVSSSSIVSMLRAAPMSSWSGNSNCGMHALGANTAETQKTMTRTQEKGAETFPTPWALCSGQQNILTASSPPEW